MYTELPYRLDGAVVWTNTGTSNSRVLPDGCLDLIWLNGTMIVAGPDTHAHLSPAMPGATCVGVRFRPGQGPGVLGLPAAEVRDCRPDLDRVWPATQARRLAEVVGGAADRPAALAAEVAWRLRRAGPLDPVTEVVSASLLAGHTVAATADAVGLGPRQLHRMSLHAFGYGPKTLAKVLRFRRALALAHDGVPFATVAATTGYADQAHLSREVRLFTGVPLRTLLGDRVRTGGWAGEDSG